MENLVRSLLCKIPLPESTFANDAHYHCDFGQWFYNNSSSSLRKLAAINQLETFHTAMHDSARELCLTAKVMGMANENEYDKFIQKTALFKDALTQLKKRVVFTLHHLSSKQH